MVTFLSFHVSDLNTIGGGMDFVPDQGAASAPEQQGEQVSAASEQAKEAYREASKHAQAELKKLKKQEGSQKKRTSSLVDLLIHLLNMDTKDPTILSILNLIVRLLSFNISVNMIIAILSLYFSELEQALAYEDSPSPITATMLTARLKKELAIEEAREFHQEDLPLDLKNRINTWVSILVKTVTNDYELYGLDRIPHTQHPALPTVTQLSVFVLEATLKEYHIRGQYDELKDFVSFILGGILKRYQPAELAE